MTSWRHPRLGEIQSLPRHLQPKKTWKHLYDTAEHWERLCGLDVAIIRSAAEAALGVRRSDHLELPWVDGERWSLGRPLLLEHHRAGYMPTYLEEMASPETIWTPEMDVKFRHFALTPRSVFIVVELGEPTCVVTAYRPQDWGTNVDMDESELRRYGVNYFRDKTQMNIQDRARITVEELERSSASVPSTVNELRWLVSAVGFGRLLAERDEVKPALDAAERVLARVPEELLVKLKRAIDWGGCLDRLGEALQDPRPEDLEDVLTVTEELLAMASPLRADEEADAFWQKAEALIAWLPAGWHHLSRHAESRRVTLGDADHRVTRMWRAIEDAVLGAVMREAEPAVRPEPRYLDLLIPVASRDSIWKWVKDRAARWANDLMGPLRELLASVHVQQPAPTMGSAPTAEEWRVLAPKVPTAAHYKAFIIDDENVDGVDVSEDLQREDHCLWIFDRPDERAVLVVIVSDQPLLADNLSSLLTESESRQDVAIEALELHPTQATKAKR